MLLPLLPLLRLLGLLWLGCLEKLLLLLSFITERRAGFTFGLETSAPLARLVTDSFAAQLLSMTAIASFPDHIISHGRGPIASKETVVGKT
jgi:hypothetical protein